MSKMSQLQAELSEQVNELGFESLQDAIENGYEINYHNSKLEKVKSVDELEKAHESWLKEKAIVLGDLRNLLIAMSVAGQSNTTEFGIIQRAIEFIERGEE